MKRRASVGGERSGAALVIAILLMTLLVLVLGTLTRIGLAERTQARAEERRLRASWLAESGLERAWTKILADPSYVGETWEIPAETLHDSHAASVLIRAEPIADRPGTRRVVARADFPKDGASRARQTRTTFMNLPVNHRATR
jgi:hypothetical protein